MALLAAVWFSEEAAAQRPTGIAVGINQNIIRTIKNKLWPLMIRAVNTIEIPGVIT